MTIEGILQKLEELLEPQLIDPYYSEDDMFFHRQIEELIERIRDED
jgi:hypothetical protein